MSLLNRHILKPETVQAVEAAGPRVVETVDRWAGGWPKITKQLEQEGRLLQEAQERVKMEQRAMDYKRENPELYLTTSEALELYGVPLYPIV